MTNEEMRMIEETLFPVEAIPAAHPLYEHEGYENMPSGYQYIMRNDTCEIISCMTDDYVLVPNERLMDVAIPTLDKLNARLMEATVFNNARTLYTFTFPDIKIDIDENDLVNPQIIIKNSYDGTVGVNLLAGAFRIVCSNGLVIGFVVGEINTKHLIYNKNIEHLEEIIDISLFKINNIIEKDVKKLVEKAPVKPEHLVKTAGLFPKRIVRLCSSIYDWQPNK